MDRRSSSEFISLDGEWQIKAHSRPDEVDINETLFDVIPVPASVQMHGYDQLQYLNCRYPFPWHKIDTVINEHYKKLGALRRGEKIFAGGEFKITRAEGGYFEFIRYKKEEKHYVKVAVNMGEPLRVEAAGGVNLYRYREVHDFLRCVR